MTTTLDKTDFQIDLTDHVPEPNLPQRIGGRLWLPMLVMALTGFAAGSVLAAMRADAVGSGASETTVASLGHFVPAAMFIGFAAVFSAISFAIARILGEFRAGGGAVQQAAGRPVETLRMPATAMMTIVVAVIAHIAVGVQIASGSTSLVANAEQWGIRLEGVRRFGVALYLFAIALGLSTIIHVLRFQSIRVRELAEDTTR